MLSPTHSGAVTTYNLKEPLRSPNSIYVAIDRSIWFGEVGLRGVAHLFLNGTLSEYAWPSSHSIPADRCYDLSEMWGLASWHGLIWASDSANQRILGLDPSVDRFDTISLSNGTLPGFIAIDLEGNLWFTESSPPARLGEVNGATGLVSYYSMPEPDQFSSSLLFRDETRAYVTTVNPDTDLGHLFVFDPTAPVLSFKQVDHNETLLGPYSMALAQGGIWVSEHHASNIAFLDSASGKWTFYPTSTDPRIPLSLPYFLQANGTQVWFNEHDAGKLGVICCERTSLTEYNLSSSSPTEAGIGNVLTIGLGKNLVWFTAWTGNQIGYVNASHDVGFSIVGNATRDAVTVRRGSSATVQLHITGTSSRPLRVLFSDSESQTAVPSLIAIAPDIPTLPGLDGPKDVNVTITASTSLAPGSYVLLMTVTDGFTYRSVYVAITAT
jgi:streptogramin lyase